MSNCINKSHPDIVKMAEELNTPPAVIAAKVGVWQTKNNIFDRFPTKDEFSNNENYLKNNLIENLLDEKNKNEIFNINDVDLESKNKTVDNTQLNIQLLFNSDFNQSYLVDDVLNNILTQIPNNLNNNFKDLINKASKIIGNTKAKVIIDSLENMSTKYKNVDSSVAMLYDPDTNKIVISEEALSKLNSQETVQSFIHEVVHAIIHNILKNPQTFEQKELVQFFKDAFEQHKQIALERGGLKSTYGFENLDEFVAEIFSNPDFQNELKQNTSFWQELKDVIRRIFGLVKSLKNNELIDSILLINKVNDFVEQTNNSDFKGYSYEGEISFDALFIRNTALKESEGYKLDTIQDQISNVLNKAKDILDQNIGYYKAVSKSVKDESKKAKWTSFINNFDETLKSLETIENGKELQGIVSYVKSLKNGITKLKNSFENKDFTDEEAIQVVHNYTKYLDSFSIHKDIQTLLSNIKASNKGEFDFINLEELEINLGEVISDYSSLKSEYTAYLRNALKLKLSNLKYLPELETMWKNKLKEEYKSSPKNLSQTEWIANAMNTTYKEDIDLDIQEYLNKLINNPSFDISIGTHFFNDAINTNSHLIQIFNQILNEVKEDINQTMRKKEFELKELFDKLCKEKNSTNPSVLYKNLLVKTPNSTHALTNDYSKLSSIEKEVVEKFKEIQDYVDYSTYKKQSKILKINGIKYYELPSISKSDLERVLEGDIKGIIKDKWTDLTTIKSDDVEFRYKTDNEYNILYNVPVRYRGKIDYKDQSLDLFTIYRLEYLNGVNYKVKTKAENDLTTILDIAKSKDYYRTQGNKEFVKSIFNKRNDISLIKGADSNTVKRLQSLLEKNIYDIGNHYAGKIGSVDVNKAISFANSAIAAIGLNLNRYAATANVLNAKAQMFLESISKGTIDKTNLAKAEALYTKELFNTMNDMGQSVEKSFINQMNRMFDTFGFNQNSMNDFVKQGILKSYTNLESLQFMHTAGEHWVQSVLTAAVLDSIKVMNSNNRFIDKNGKETTENKAASLLDMLYIDKNDSLLKINENVVYTTKSLTSKINEGGKEKINLLVEKKISDCFGNYNKNTQPEAKRHAWGKLVLMFRGFFTEMLTRRYKAFGNSFKTKDEIEANPEKYKHYNYALQEYEEGAYTSLVRFIRHGIIPMLKQMKLDIIKTEWSKLSDLEKSNIKFSISEVVNTLVLLPLIGVLLGSLLGSGDDEDDELIYFWLYQTRRMITELAQFRNPSENIKMTRSPIPSMRILEQSLDAISKTLNPFSWNEELKSGPNKGDLKVTRAWEKLIPVLNQFDKNSEDLYNYQKSMFGLY